MLATTLILSTFALSASTLAIAPRACAEYSTISDPGFYVAASTTSPDFPDDPNYYENQILQYQIPSGATQCSLRGDFERDFLVRVSASGPWEIEAYVRKSSTEKTHLGTLSYFPIEDGKTNDIVSAPLGTFTCATDVTFEFQLKLEEAGTYANVAFDYNDESGFFVLAC
jgi:hypothetical protein